MAEEMPRKPPLPVTQLFLACHEIFQDRRSGMPILVGPTTHVPIKQFPAHVRLSFFAEFTGCHGSYQMRLALRDGNDEVVWGWTVPEQLKQENPLIAHRYIFYDLMVAVPRPGRYSLVLLLNGEEVAQRGMSFAP